MVFYQLKAMGCLALDKNIKMNRISKEIFIDRSDAEAFVPVFQERMSTPSDVKDIGYLDAESIQVRIHEIVLAGTIETEDMGTIAVEIDLPTEEIVATAPVALGIEEDELLVGVEDVKEETASRKKMKKYG